MFELIFHPEAQQEIFALDSAMQGKALAALDKLELQGNQLRYPHTDIIQEGHLSYGRERKILHVLFSLLLREEKYSFYGHLSKRHPGRHRQKSK